MPDLGGTGIDPTFTLPELLAETWGTTPEKVSAIFDRFSSPPDGDAALRRLGVVRRSPLLGYAVLERPDGVEILPRGTLNFSEAFSEARRLAGWV